MAQRAAQLFTGLQLELVLVTMRKGHFESNSVCLISRNVPECMIRAPSPWHKYICIDLAVDEYVSPAAPFSTRRVPPRTEGLKDLFPPRIPGLYSRNGDQNPLLWMVENQELGHEFKTA